MSANLNCKLKDFQEKLDQLQDELKTSRADAEKARKAQSQLEKALDSSRQQSKQAEDQFQEERKRLTQQVELSTNSLKRLEQQVSNQDQTHTETLAVFEAQLKSAQEETELVRQQAAGDLAKLAGQRDELDRKLFSTLADDEIARLQTNKTVTALKQELSSLQERHSKLQEEMSGLRQSNDVADIQHLAAVDNLVAELSQARESLEEMVCLQQQFESERDNLLSVHDEALAEANQRTRQVEEELRVLQEMQNTRQGDYKENLIGLQSRLDEAGNQLLRRDKELHSLNERLEILQRESAEAAQERESLAQSLEVAKQTHQALEQDYEVSRVELGQAQQKAGELEQALQASDERCDDLEKEFKAQGKARESLEQEHRQSVAELDTEMTQVKQTVDELQRSNQQLVLENQALQEKLIALEEVLGNEQQEKLDLGKEIHELLARIEDLQEKKTVAEVQEQLNLSSFECALEESRAETETSLEALNETRIELKKLDEQRLKLHALFEQEHDTVEFLRRSLETAEEAVDISDRTIENNLQEIDKGKRRLTELRTDMERLETQKNELEQAHNHGLQEQENERARLSRNSRRSSPSSVNIEDRDSLRWNDCRQKRRIWKSSWPKTRKTCKLISRLSTLQPLINSMRSTD